MTWLQGKTHLLIYLVESETFFFFKEKRKEVRTCQCKLFFCSIAQLAAVPWRGCKFDKHVTLSSDTVCGKSGGLIWNTSYMFFKCKVRKETRETGALWPVQRIEAVSTVMNIILSGLQVFVISRFSENEKVQTNPRGQKSLQLLWSFPIIHLFREKTSV